MARVQLIIPDDDRVRFGDQARREGLSLSAWIRAAAHERFDRQSKAGRFTSRDEIRAFFAECDTLDGPEVEPDWERHLAVIGRSRGHGATDT